MPLAKIKTEEERARLDAIFAEIEAIERGEQLPKEENARLNEVLKRHGITLLKEG